MGKERLFDKLRSVFAPKKEPPTQPTVRKAQEPYGRNPSSPDFPWPWRLSPEARSYIREGSASNYESARQVLIMHEPHESREGQFGLYKFLETFFRDNPTLIRKAIFLAEGYPTNERLSTGVYLRKKRMDRENT